MRKFPLGDQSFAEIIDENFLYADKTPYIYDLLTSPIRNYFLSRPRRFGKTLLIRTLKELFTGERRRFKGLWIDSSDYDFPRLPVVYLNWSMESAQNVTEGLFQGLSHVADEHDLTIAATTRPRCYLRRLVMALHKKYDSKVAVLIDDYDASVTRNLDKPELAKANAETLCAFLGMLKDVYVSERVVFTLVTGVTRYALTSPDWGPRHLYDISLDPRNAGICGFTVDEFEPLFVDRLEETLARLKDSGWMPPSATIDDLRASIQDWYGGYNWGGETRVLNPFSTLKFFDQAAFYHYWPDSGRPGHLKALIKARPMDFLAPDLGLRRTADVERPEIYRLQAVPVLFHSGYLTVDKIIPVQPLGPVDGPTNHERITFRFPNREVESFYLADCLRVILDLGSAEELTDKGVKIREALLNRDFETLERELETLFPAINCHQRPDSEAEFLALVKSFLMGLGLNVPPEVSGLESGPDLLVELSDREFVVIGLRRLKGEDPLEMKAQDRLERKAEDRLLESLARERLSDEAINNVLIDAFLDKLHTNKKKRLISEAGLMDMSSRELHLALSELAGKGLSPSEKASSLAFKARKELPDEAANVLREAAANFGLAADKRIGGMLTKAAQGIVTDLAKRGRHGVVGREDQIITALGLAILGCGERVKAVFGPAYARNPGVEKIL